MSSELGKDRELVRSVWPEWELLELLGYGQFGVVYKARKKGFAGYSNAAVKIVTIEHQTKENGFSPEQTDSYLASVAQNYAREIQMMECVKGYSNIVNIDDYTVVKNSGGKPWYVLIRMELLSPLYAYLEEHEPAEEDISRIGSDLCRALEICKARKIVHRDIKPANVFVNSDGVFKLGDFGVARQIMDYTFQTKTGTPDYMAPEVYNGALNAADFERAHRADIYSVGMLLYWIANGRCLPFIRKDGLITADEISEAFQKRMSGEPLPPPAKVSPFLQEVILKACSFDSAQRYQTAEEFREALEKKNEPQRQEAEPPAPKEEAPRSKWKILCLVLLLAAAVAAAVIWLSGKGKTTDPADTTKEGQGSEETISSEEPSPAPEPTEEPEDSGSCGEKLRWQISGTELRISGTGGMYDYSTENRPPWNEYGSRIERVVVEEGATKIGKYAFFRLENLAEVELPGSLRRINTMAFGYCSQLSSLNLPEGVEHIEKSIVYRCPQLKSIRLPGSIQLIEGSFAGECENLAEITLGNGCKDYVLQDGVLFDASMEELICHPAGLEDLSYTIPEKVRTVGVYAFAENGNLTEVILPDGLVTIDSCAFSGCRNLKSVTIPDSVATLGIYAFYGCEKLREVRLPNRITWLEQQAFYGCSSLREIVIPSGVTRIGTYVFGNCSALEKIVIPDSVTSITVGAFEGSPNVVIYCGSGSYAEQFAIENSIPSVNVESDAAHGR